MLNNKGQSLVLFVIVLPILMLILILVIDVGGIIVLKQELSNISEIVLDYGLDKIDDNELEMKLNNLVKLNKQDIDKIDIYLQDEKIYLKLEDKSKGIFSGFVDISIFNVQTSYVGYVESEEKRIERLGDEYEYFFRKNCYCFFG